MWIAGEQRKDNFKDYNHEVKLLSGNLNDIEAKITLAKFLKSNIGMTLKLISGFDMFNIQEVLIKAILNRDVSLIVAGRGFSKSTIISILSILYPILYPNSKICLISSNFRSSRRIMEEAEKIVNRKEAALLRSCFPEDMRKSNDIYKWRLSNGSEIFSLPLSTGNGLRGTRAGALFLDEYLNLSSEIVNTILTPFLTVKQNVEDEIKIRRIEDELILKGVITEKDRISFPRNKLAAFSSASYTFQYLYEVYSKYLDNINAPPQFENTIEAPPTYFVARLSYEVLDNETLFDKTQINAAMSQGGENSDYFRREYKGLFSSGNDGFFSAKTLHNSTVAVGDYPTTQIKGDKENTYLLSIDPSYSSQKSSDQFGMQLYLLNNNERKIILTHNYARVGGDITQHFQYLTYLLKYFNIVFIVIDSSGDEMVKGYNESSIAAEAGFKLDFFDVDCDTDDATQYFQEIKKMKNQYNILNKRIVLAQKFNSSNGSIRRMNENLKNQLEAGKVWFASPAAANESEFTKQINIHLPIEFKDNDDKVLNTIDFIELQDSLIKECKNQISLIEVRSSGTGSSNLTYDLPQSLRRLTSKNRPRRDLYTCCLMGTWAARLYFDLLFTDSRPQNVEYIPRLI